VYPPCIPQSKPDRRLSNKLKHFGVHVLWRAVDCQGATLYAADSALSRPVHKVSQADLTHKPSRAIIAPDDPRETSAAQLTGRPRESFLKVSTIAPLRRCCASLTVMNWPLPASRPRLPFLSIGFLL